MSLRTCGPTGCSISRRWKRDGAGREEDRTDDAGEGGRKTTKGSVEDREAKLYENLQVIKLTYSMNDAQAQDY